MDEGVLFDEGFLVIDPYTQTRHGKPSCWHWLDLMVALEKMNFSHPALSHLSFQSYFDGAYTEGSKQFWFIASVDDWCQVTVNSTPQSHAILQNITIRLSNQSFGESLLKLLSDSALKTERT